MSTDTTQIDLNAVSADVEALLKRAGYDGPVEDIRDLAAEERSLQRQELAGYEVNNTSNVRTRGSHENGAGDPKKDAAKKRHAYKAAGLSISVTQQLTQLTQQLTQQISVLTTEIAGLEARELDLARQEGVLGEQIEVAEETAEAAEAQIDETLTEIDGHADDLQAALDSRHAVEDELCTAPADGGLTDLSPDQLLDTSLDIDSRVSDGFTAIDEANNQARMAFQQIDSASVRIYEQQQVRDQALGDAQELTTEQQLIRDERLGVQTQITTLTEELNLTEAQLAALDDEVVLDAIRSGEMTPQEAIDGVTRPTALNGSTLATPAAADTDGRGVNASVELTGGFNASASPTPAEAAPELSQADLVMQQALSPTHPNTFAPA